jgi:hypothetical protein
MADSSRFDSLGRISSNRANERAAFESMKSNDDAIDPDITKGASRANNAILSFLFFTMTSLC